MCFSVFSFFVTSKYVFKKKKGPWGSKKKMKAMVVLI